MQRRLHTRSAALDFPSSSERSVTVHVRRAWQPIFDKTISSQQSPSFGFFCRFLINGVANSSERRAWQFSQLNLLRMFGIRRMPKIFSTFNMTASFILHCAFSEVMNSFCEFSTVCRNSQKCFEWNSWIPAIAYKFALRSVVRNINNGEIASRVIR